jgi:hypothetical protein
MHRLPRHMGMRTSGGTPRRSQPPRSDPILTQSAERDLADHQPLHVHSTHFVRALGLPQQQSCHARFAEKPCVVQRRAQDGRSVGPPCEPSQ